MAVHTTIQPSGSILDGLKIGFWLAVFRSCFLLCISDLSGAAPDPVVLCLPTQEGLITNLWERYQCCPLWHTRSVSTVSTQTLLQRIYFDCLLAGWRHILMSVSTVHDGSSVQQPLLTGVQCRSIVGTIFIHAQPLLLSFRVFFGMKDSCIIHEA